MAPPRVVGARVGVITAAAGAAPSIASAAETVIAVAATPKRLLVLLPIRTSLVIDVPSPPTGGNARREY